MSAMVRLGHGSPARFPQIDERQRKAYLLHDHLNLSQDDNLLTGHANRLDGLADDALRLSVRVLRGRSIVENISIVSSSGLQISDRSVAP